MTSLIRYEAAKAALVEARSVDEVLEVRRASERMKLYARQAKDRSLLADATQIQVRAERKLGVMIISAKETGQLGLGRPSRSNVVGASEAQDDGEVVAEDNAAEPEAFSRTTLKEAGIDHKLSSQAQKWARLGEEEFDARLSDIRERIESAGAVTINPKINGARAIMGSRREPDDSLDYFPTPPWATRALVEDVLPRLGLSLDGMLVGEPACGEGHIAGVIEEHAPLRVHASDVFDYSVDGRQPPGWIGVKDFADPEQGFGGLDWIISNFPFGDKALPMTLRALDSAAVGVALFVRQQWLEGVDRYEQLFSVRPPTLVAQFSERVNLCKGRWEPDGSTATAYCWLVWMAGWLKGPPDGMHTRLLWIPPGRRAARERIDDRERFTAHPVLKFLPDTQRESGTAREAPGGTAPSDGIAGLSEGQRLSSEGEPAARSAPVTTEQQGAQPAPHHQSQAKTEAAAIAAATEGELPPADAEPVSRLAAGRTAAAGEGDAYTSPAPLLGRAESGTPPLPASRHGLPEDGPVKGPEARFAATPLTGPSSGDSGGSTPALSRAARDDVIREVYARDMAVDFAEISRRTGLDKVRARKRAYQLGLSSRERQRAAASAYTTGQHARGEL